MSFHLALRQDYYEVDSVQELEKVLPEIVIQSLNYCAGEKEPFTPTYAILKKDQVTVHFLVEYENMIVYFDVLRRDKHVDCAALPLRQFFTGERSIATEAASHMICEQIQSTLKLQDLLNK